MKSTKAVKKKIVTNSIKYEFSHQEISYCRNSLLTWYNINRRHLPWRGDIVNSITPPPVSPYGIWVSEVMLQQTKVETVCNYWLKWMTEFPTIG